MTDTKVETATEFKNQIPSSLRFPKLDLSTCLEKIKILFTQNSTNAMSVGAMSSDLGYAQSGGAAHTILASLKYYGMLELSGNDRYKISDFIINFCLDNPLTRDDTKKCLFSVPVNKKLFATYDIDNLPGDNEIKSFLIKECKYSLKEATAYIEIFKKNRAIYNNFNMNTNSMEPTVEHALPRQSSVSPPVSSNIPDAVPLRHSNAFVYTHPLSGGKYITIQLSDNLNELHINDLEDAKDLLVLVVSKIERRAQHLKKQISHSSTDAGDSSDSSESLFR